jgi:SAM-dependent methyltransferase
MFREEVDLGVDVYSEIPLGYRRAVQDVATVLLHWRRLLDQREDDLRSSPSDQAPREIIQDLEEVSEKRLRADWFATRSRANSEADRILSDAPAALRSAKILTETLVTPILACAPIWRRAYEKPRGYPGDFELMNYMYEETRCGDSVFARIMHQLGREERLAATVRNRRDLLARKIREATRRVAQQKLGPVRITNIGSGPARELEDLVRSSGLDGRALVYLVDQDEAALAHAFERVTRASASFPDEIELRCRHVSFGQLLRQSILLDEFRNQDLIYSAGLLDYLPDGIAQTLVTRLVELLRPGGCVLVGNAAVDSGVRWVPDFVLDWSMIYRTREEMLSLAAQARGVESVSVEADDSRAWHFLLIRKA